MKKETVYTNLDSEPFTVNLEATNDSGDRFLNFSIVNGGNSFYLLNLAEVEDFCKLLKDVWAGNA